MVVCTFICRVIFVWSLLLFLATTASLISLMRSFPGCWFRIWATAYGVSKSLGNLIPSLSISCVTKRKSKLITNDLDTRLIIKIHNCFIATSDIDGCVTFLELVDKLAFVFSLRIFLFSLARSTGVMHLGSKISVSYFESDNSLKIQLKFQKH